VALSVASFSSARLAAFCDYASIRYVRIKMHINRHGLDIILDCYPLHTALGL